MFALCVRRKNTAFEIQILPSVKFSIPHTNKLAECRELWQGLLTVCISLCAIRKCPHISLLRWFVKSVLLTFGFELLSWCRHNLWHNAWNRFHQQLLGKNWYEFNSIVIKYNRSVSILDQIPQVEGCSSNRLSRTRTSGPKTHFLHIKKWIALYEF